MAESYIEKSNTSSNSVMVMSELFASRKFLDLLLELECWAKMIYSGIGKDGSDAT